MAIEVARLRAVVEADLARFLPPMDQAQRKLEETGRKGIEAGEKIKQGTDAAERASVALRAQIGLLSATLNTLVAGAGVSAFKALTGAASDMNETLGKSRVVFGQMSAAVESWAKDAARSMGQSRQAALENAATFGNLFVSMGMGRQAAAQMSTQLTQLASDLASFNNTRPEEAFIALRAALVGETEPMRRFGVNLNQAALEAEALRMGLVKSTKEGLEPATKAAAAYSLILQQTKTAQGDFGRTAGGVANQQRILTAEFKDASAALGQNLLPLMNQLLREANGLLQSFNALPRETQKLALEFGALGLASGPLAQCVRFVGSLSGALYGLSTAAGLSGLAAIGATGGVAAAGLGAAALAARDLLTYLDAINQTNRARELDASLGKYGDALKLRDLSADLTQHIQYLRDLQRLRREGLSPKGPGGQIAEELRGALAYAGLSEGASANQIEAAIGKIAKQRADLGARAAKVQTAALKAQAQARAAQAAAAGAQAGVGFNMADFLRGSPTFAPQGPSAEGAAATAKRTAQQIKAALGSFGDAVANRELDRFTLRARDLKEKAQTALEALAGDPAMLAAHGERVRTALKKALEGNHEQAQAFYAKVRAERVKDARDKADAASRALLGTQEDSIVASIEQDRSAVLQGRMTLAQAREDLSGLLQHIGVFPDAYRRVADEVARISAKIAAETAAGLKATVEVMAAGAGGMFGGTFGTLGGMVKARTEEEKLTLRLRAAVADAGAAYSRAAGHSDRYAEVLARLNLETANLTKEQRALILQFVEWEEVTEDVARASGYLDRLSFTVGGSVREGIDAALLGDIRGAGDAFGRRLRDSIRGVFASAIGDEVSAALRDAMKPLADPLAEVLRNAMGGVRSMLAAMNVSVSLMLSQVYGLLSIVGAMGKRQQRGGLIGGLLGLAVGSLVPGLGLLGGASLFSSLGSAVASGDPTSILLAGAGAYDAASQAGVFARTQDLGLGSGTIAANGFGGGALGGAGDGAGLGGGLPGLRRSAAEPGDVSVNQHFYGNIGTDAEEVRRATTRAVETGLRTAMVSGGGGSF